MRIERSLTLSLSKGEGRPAKATNAASLGERPEGLRFGPSLALRCSSLKTVHWTVHTLSL